MKKMGYKEMKNKKGDLSVKIRDTALAQQVKAHCKLVNMGTSDFVSECVRKYMDDARLMYLQSLSKEDLIEMLLERSE